jgi:CRP/FNR family transcriptional regulator, nitrogen fixation regulation protein
MSIQSAIAIDQGFNARTTSRAAPLMAQTAPTSAWDDALAPARPAVQFAPDSPIYDEGDDARTFYKVVSGVVRTCKLLSDGRRQIDAFHGAGDIVGLEIDGVHRMYAEAVSNCVLVPYRRQGLEAMVAADGQLAQQFFSYAMRRLARAQDHSLLLGRCTAIQRVAAFLLDHADERDIVELAMARQDIADYLGLTIETVSRTITQFERDGVVEMLNARRIRLEDREALEDLIA